MKTKVFLLTVLCFTSYGAEKYRENKGKLSFKNDSKTRTVSRSVVRRQSQWWDYLPLCCPTLCNFVCCCCKKADMVVIEDGGNNVRLARSSTDLRKD